jgi:NAD(P)H-hydrate repair Nnr-like enzyme with NAD(P)H-hydrate dehydratase domain
MDHTYWRKQSPTEPLYPDLLWAKPESKKFAGKLLIIGGNSQAFMAAAEAHQLSEAAGIGSTRVLMPDSLQKLIGKGFEAGEFAPSTKAGGFSQAALDSFVDLSLWSDGVLIAGDLGRNSETTIVLERFLELYDEQVTIINDAADLIIQQPMSVLQRPKTLLVLSPEQLQKLGVNAHFPRAFTSSAPLLQVLENLHEFTKRYLCTIITKHGGNYIVASDGEVSTTMPKIEHSTWRMLIATQAATWWLQQPSKPFEAMTTAIYSAIKDTV